MKRIFLFSLCIIIFFLSLTSCATEYEENDHFYGGESLNADILSSIAESIFNEMESSESQNEQIENSSGREHDGVYYWTSSGSVYHKWSDCGHLKNSSDIMSGNEQDAILAGKEKLCSSCAKKE